MNQEERKTAIRRMRVLVAAACILMLLYGLRLIFLQLVNGDDFKSQATNTTDYKFTVTAARGDIVDSRGERIATSVTGYNVVLNKLLMGDEDLDGMLQKIVELLRANGESWNDTLLISQPDAAGNYTFTAEAGSTRDQKALAAMKDNLGLQQYATANDVMEKLVEDYDLASFPLSWKRTLGGIHYEMQLQAFSNVNNFIMAENVSEATVATIKERSLSLPGVEIVETSTRSYEQSTVLPHVLGRVGKITAEKWKVTDENGQTTYPLREKGYNMNDIIGISGLESAYEDELRGKDGVETITRNSDGVIVDTALTTVPEPGHTVQLTIGEEGGRITNIQILNLAAPRGDIFISHAIVGEDIAHEELYRTTLHTDRQLDGVLGIYQLLKGVDRAVSGDCNVEYRLHDRGHAVKIGQRISEIAAAHDGLVGNITVGVTDDSLIAVEQRQIGSTGTGLYCAGNVGSKGVDVLANLNAHSIGGRSLGSHGHNQIIGFRQTGLSGGFSGSGRWRILGTTAGKYSQHHAEGKHTHKKLFHTVPPQILSSHWTSKL